MAATAPSPRVPGLGAVRDLAGADGHRPRDRRARLRRPLEQRPLLPAGRRGSRRAGLPRRPGLRGLVDPVRLGLRDQPGADGLPRLGRRVSEPGAAREDGDGAGPRDRAAEPPSASAPVGSSGSTRRSGSSSRPFGRRLDRMGEAAAICRGLLDGESVTHDGQWFSAVDARNDPPPIQARLPLAIGGSGEKRTLRFVAEYADIWNADQDSPESFHRRSEILDEHCRAVGRDPATIERTAGLPAPCIRPTREEAVEALTATLQHQAMSRDDALRMAMGSPFTGPVDTVVAELAPVSRRWPRRGHVRLAGAVRSPHARGARRPGPRRARRGGLTQPELDGSGDRATRSEPPLQPRQPMTQVRLERGFRQRELTPAVGRGDAPERGFEGARRIAQAVLAQLRELDPGHDRGPSRSGRDAGPRLGRFGDTGRAGGADAPGRARPVARPRSRRRPPSGASSTVRGHGSAAARRSRPGPAATTTGPRSAAAASRPAGVGTSTAAATAAGASARSRTSSRHARASSGRRARTKARASPATSPIGAVPARLGRGVARVQQRDEAGQGPDVLVVVAHDGEPAARPARPAGTRGTGPGSPSRRRRRGARPRAATRSTVCSRASSIRCRNSRRTIGSRSRCPSWTGAARRAIR